MSLARDVYGNNMTERQARRAIGGVTRARGSVPVVRVRSSVKVVDYIGTCRAGGDPLMGSCICSCHDDGGLTPCDRTLTIGRRCDGSVIA